MKIMKAFIVVISVLGLIIGGIYLFILQAVDFESQPLENTYIISFDDIDEKIYAKGRTWGLGSNHSEIILSGTPIENDHLEYFENQLVYKDCSTIFYRKKGLDSLELYVDYSLDNPQKLSSKLEIIQIEMRNAEQVEDYRNNYEKYGLSAINVLPE